LLSVPTVYDLHLWFCIWKVWYSHLSSLCFQNIIFLTIEMYVHVTC
jgi:hypothetical protein